MVCLFPPRDSDRWQRLGCTGIYWLGEILYLMCEFLLRVHDKKHAETEPDKPYLDVKLMQRGDIVECRDNGWPWSHLERSEPFWRIVKIPQMSLEEGQTYLAREPGNKLLNKMLQKRQFKLNLDNPALPASIRDFINDDTRAVDSITINANSVRNIRTTKDPVPDPNVFA